MRASYRQHNPDGRFFLLLLDEPATQEDLAGWTVIRAEEMELPDLPALRMLYTAYELSMALRPAFLLHVMRHHNAEKVIHVDADLYFTGSIAIVGDRLDEHSIMLTPSFLTPIPEDGRFPTDREFLAAGMYNGGFIGCRNCEETLRILTWLDARLKKYSFLRPEDNMFGDQRWLDLLPGLTDDLLILRDDTFNVAFWNLHERTVTAEDNRYFVNDKPMAFFHFSGFRSGRPPILSVFQTRTELSKHPALLQLCEEYQEQLLKSGHEQRKRESYLFDRFENGVAITPVIRRIYEMIEGSTKFPRPFSPAGESYFRWLCEPISYSGTSLHITNLHLAIHTMSIEAAGRFPQPKTVDQKAFALWLLGHRNGSLPLDPVFLTSLKRYLQKSDLKPLRSRIQRFLRRRHSFGPYQHLCKFMKSVIGRSLYNALKPHDELPVIPRFLLKTHRSGQAGGINVIAGIGAQSGIGEAVRGHIEAFRAADVPIAVSNARTAPGREQAVLPEQRHKGELIYASTLMEGGLHDLQRGLELLPRTCADSRLIGHLAWELETIPERAVGFLNQFDELWVGSRFIRDGIADQLSVPVLTIPYFVNVTNVSMKKRNDFTIPEHATVFLFIFDFYSHIERKNPLGLIEAFRKAFGDDPNKLLIIKHSHGNAFPGELKSLVNAAAGSTNIRLMQEYIPRPDLLALMRCANAYVSLHRAEGFGLTMAEAMALCIPVIATDYGGSTDFLNPETGFPIPWKLKTIEKNIGPYEEGMQWAEPEIDAAAEAMRSIITNRDDAKARAARAKAFIEEHFNLKTIGERMKRRVARLDADVA